MNIRTLLVAAILGAAGVGHADAQESKGTWHGWLTAGIGLSNFDENGTGDQTAAEAALCRGHLCMGARASLAEDNIPMGVGNRRLVAIFAGPSYRGSKGRIGIGLGIARIRGSNSVPNERTCGFIFACVSESMIKPAWAGMVVGHAMIAGGAVGLGMEPYVAISRHSPVFGVTLNLFVGWP